MIGRRLAGAAWLLFAGALMASCGGNSISRIEDRGAGAEDGLGATGGDLGNGGGVTTGGVTSGGATTGGVTSGGATTGGLGGAAGSGQSGSGGAGGTGGEGAEGPCPDRLPSVGVPCGGDLVGTWISDACPLAVSGDAILSGLGFSLECMSAPVFGSLRVTGTVTFNADTTYSDDTITSGESTMELAPQCLEISGTTTTCDVVGGPLQSLGYGSFTCVANAVTGGCTCSGTFRREGGLAFVAYEASSRGTYTTGGNYVTLTSLGDDTEYAYCVSADAQLLTLSLQTLARIGMLAQPILLVKR